MIITLEDFIKEYKKICNSGWIQTHRAGDTGIGKTLEDLLGIPENNNDGPDFGDYELKSCRINSKSLLTLFTRAPQPAKSNTFLRLKYGYLKNTQNNNVKVLHTTLNANRFTSIANTNHKLKITCYNDKIYIESEEGKENIFWSHETLEQCFNKKYKDKFIYAKADSKGKGASEKFKFIEAYEISNFNYDKFIQLLKAGKIYIDLRIGQHSSGPNKGKTHDHGTGFRIHPNNLPLLFSHNIQIV